MSTYNPSLSSLCPPLTIALALQDNVLFVSVHTRLLLPFVISRPAQDAADFPLIGNNQTSIANTGTADPTTKANLPTFHDFQSSIEHQLITAMSFKQDFESHVNHSMQNDAGRRSSINHRDDVHVKKGPIPSTPVFEEYDAEISEKKDRPPRFSTLFGAEPAPVAREFDSYPQPKRGAGVFLPLPLFILFVVVFLFMCTVLFAYTVIGLYNNLPSRLLPSNPGGCDCRQPAINIAPNFLLGQGQAVVTETVTLGGEFLPSSTSSASTNTNTQAAAAASDILGMLSGVNTKSSSSSTADPGATATTTYTTASPPPRSTVESVTLLTVTPSESARPTVTSVLVINSSQAAAASSSQAAQKAAQSALAKDSAALSVAPIPSSTTLTTSASSSSSVSLPPVTTPPSPPSSSVSPKPAPTPVPTSSKRGGVCIGAGTNGYDYCNS